MPDFYYEGVSREGEKLKGQVFADNETELRIKLRTQKIRPVKIKELAPRKPGVAIKRSSTDKTVFSDEEKIFFVKEMLVMFRAGLTVTQSLDVISAEGSTLNMKNTASALRGYMESGMTFSQSLTRFPRHFDSLFLNLCAAGELRGRLEESMEQWLDYFKKDKEIDATVKKTVLYPVAVILIVLCALAIIVVGIAPVFVHIYRSYGQELPSSLLTVATLGDIIKENLILLAGLGLVFIGIVYLLIKNKLIRPSIDSLILNIPFLSPFFKDVYTLKTSLILNICLKSGLSLTRALELASEKIGNQTFEECLLRAKESVSKNEPAAHVFARSNLMRPMAVQIFSVGEVMGSLPDMLSELTSHLSEEIKRLSAIFSSTIEPVILTVGGLLVGSLLTSFFIPVFTLLSKIK